jgi:Amidohydrolase
VNRRDFLLSAASAACALPGIVPRAAMAQSDARARAIATWKKRINEILGRGGLPIIDSQATYVAGRTNVMLMLDNMKQLDVAQIAFAAANAPNSSPSLELHRRQPEFFIPTTNSGEFKRWPRNPGQFLAGIERDLKSGAYYLMGEYEFRHLPSPEQVAAGRKDRDVTIDIAGPAGRRLFQLSATYNTAFQIHYEIEDRLLPPLESMLARYPKAKVIWCHLAMIRQPDRAKKYGPDYVTSLIERFPGLHFDLAVPSANHVYGPTRAHDSTLYARDGALKPEWRAVMERHPQRFLAASDYRPAIEQRYGNNIGRQRKILSQLSPAVRQQVAFGNAWRLITGKPWAA